MLILLQYILIIRSGNGCEIGFIRTLIHLDNEKISLPMLIPDKFTKKDLTRTYLIRYGTYQVSG